MFNARRAKAGPAVDARCTVIPLEPRLLFSAISFGQPSYYAAGIRTPPGFGAEHVAAGDFNNDGLADLVVVGNDVRLATVVADSVRVLHGRGDGTFGAPVLSPDMFQPHSTSVAVADLNRDGNQDAVVSEDTAEGIVYVLLGNGDGTFKPSQSFHSGANSRDVAVADFNGDAVPDLAVANASPWAPFGTRIASRYAGALLIGVGDGTFDREQFIDTGNRPQQFVEAGDVNGDGAADTVFGQVVIGPGDFAAPESVVFASIGTLDVPARPATTVPAAITGLKFADLNGDGRLDVAVSAMRDLMSNGAVAATLGGLGDGRFASPKLHEAGTAIATDVAVADFNADGRPDLALAGDDPRWGRAMPVPAVITLENRGGDVFGAAEYHPLPEDVTNPGDLATGYFNRDRLPDVAVALPGSNRVGVMLNDSRAIFATSMRPRSLPLSFAGQRLSRFTTTGEHPDAGAFRAVINWGDGTQSDGTVVANDDGSYSVLGGHSYRRARIYRTSITITWGSADAGRWVPGLVRVAGPALA
jgi:hypothetical protein